MKKLIVILILLGLTGCKNSNELKAEFNCNNTAKFGEMKEMRDILKKFKMEVPNTWKTQLYYDDFKSQIFAADTTKELTATYIYDITWHQGELKLNESFAKSVSDTLSIKENMTTVKSGFGDLKKKPMYWNLAQGKKSGRLYTNLQVYLKTAIDEYFLFSTEVYGDSLVDTRLCESVSLFENIQFIE